MELRIRSPFRRSDPVLKDHLMKLNLEELKSLIATLEEGGVGEFEYEDENSRVRLSFGSSAVVAAPYAPPAVVTPAMPASPAVDDPSTVYITSPFVGTFYTAPSPKAEAFTEAGKTIKPGQTLCIVEAMKLMNEIESEISGKVLAVLVENGTSVEFGQKLFKVSKS